MEGFEVVTSDDSKIGHVVDVEGDNLVIEHGMLKKTRHAVPKTFAHSDEGEKLVRLTVSKQIVESSPKVEHDSVDTHAVAEHYGLAAGTAAPETEGYGGVPDDPEQERAEIREGGLDADRNDDKPTGYLSDRVGGR